MTTTEAKTIALVKLRSILLENMFMFTNDESFDNDYTEAEQNLILEQLDKQAMRLIKHLPNYEQK